MGGGITIASTIAHTAQPGQHGAGVLGPSGGDDAGAGIEADPTTTPVAISLDRPPRPARWGLRNRSVRPLEPGALLPRS
jgi:hypothetical protein